MSDAELLAEWYNWGDKIKSSTTWGASVAAANEFRSECERELTRRNIPIPH